MPVTDYISPDTLAAEGFIHVSDTVAIMTAAFGTVPEMVDRRLDIPEIARWLQVSTYRLKGYISDNERIGVRILDSDGCLSIRQLATMDWRRLKGQKRTPKISGSNFGGKKSKKRAAARPLGPHG